MTAAAVVLLIFSWQVRCPQLRHLRIESFNGYLMLTDVPSGNASDLTALPEKIRVPIHDVLTPDEIYNRKLAEVAPEEDPDKHVQVGVYLLQVHDYARAKQHLEAAQKFGGGAQPKKVTLYLARCATLIANKAEADLIGQINVLRNRKQFAKALDVVKEYDLRYAQGKLLSDFAKAKQLLERDRESEMVRVVTGIWYRVLRDEAAKIARNRALSWEEAQEAAEEKLGVAIRERIARAKKLTPEEIERFWKLRVERRVAKIQGSTYSTGTWVLGEQEIVKGTPYEKGKKAAQEGGQSTQQKRMNALRKRMEKFLKQARRAQKKGGDDPDEPDTEDQWWKAAATVTRQQWIMSYYAEHGSDMEVVNAFCRACITCGGRGYREVQGAVGKVQKVACGLCHKTKFIRSLRFR